IGTVGKLSKTFASLAGPRLVSFPINHLPNHDGGEVVCPVSAVESASDSGVSGVIGGKLWYSRRIGSDLKWLSHMDPFPRHTIYVAILKFQFSFLLLQRDIFFL
ncbi:hypothetical protein VIGAN_01268000, partial [Vigna angularis var. angularis]